MNEGVPLGLIIGILGGVWLNALFPRLAATAITGKALTVIIGSLAGIPGFMLTGSWYSTNVGSSAKDWYLDVLGAVFFLVVIFPLERYIRRIAKSIEL